MAAVEDKVTKDHETRIAQLEAEFKALKDSLSGLGASSAKEGAPNMDTNQIMLRINMLSMEIKSKIDVTVVNSQMEDNKKDFAEQFAAMQKRIAKSENLIEHLRNEFDSHKGKDFVALQDRVAALEKKLTTL